MLLFVSLLFSLSFSKIYLLFFQAAMATAVNPVSHYCDGNRLHGYLSQLPISARTYSKSHSTRSKKVHPRLYLMPFLPLLSPCHTVCALSYLFASV